MKWLGVILLIVSSLSFAGSDCRGKWVEHTKWQIDGMHVQGKCTCNQCHLYLFTAGSAPTTCWGCHNGSHTAAVKLPGNHVPVSPLISYDCVLCHTTSSFSSNRKPNHSMLITMSCKSCHGANYPGVESRSVTHYKKTAIDCNDSGCHNTSTFDK